MCPVGGAGGSQSEEHRGNKGGGGGGGAEVVGNVDVGVNEYKKVRIVACTGWSRHHCSSTALFRCM